VGAGDFACERGGFGAGRWENEENVKVGERQRSIKASVAAWSFSDSPGKPVMTVGADGGVREALAMSSTAAGVVLGAVPAVHRGEDAIGAGTARACESAGGCIGRSEETDEVLVTSSGSMELMRSVRRMFPRECGGGGLRIRRGGKIAAVGAEVDAAEDDLAIARFGQTLDFLEDSFWRQAAASPRTKGMTQ